MSVKDTARRQYVRLADQAAQQVRAVRAPTEGWIATLRKALAISGPQLARRAGVTKAAIYQAERNERDGAISLRQMEKLAQALGGKFVYAIIPDGQVEDVIKAQAHKKAEALVRRASSHMALEKQSLPSKLTREEIERLADEMLRDMPPDFWESE